MLPLSFSTKILVTTGLVVGIWVLYLVFKDLVKRKWKGEAFKDNWKLLFVAFGILLFDILVILGIIEPPGK